MPEPILISIAAALAGKTAMSLYDVVKRRFAGKADATAALTAADGAAPDSPQVAALATELAAAEIDDPEFAAELRSTWSTVSVDNHAEHGSVINQITGNVSGKVIQAGDIAGDVSF